MTLSPADEVIRANISFYREAAQKYDSYESWAFDPVLQYMLTGDVDLVASRLSHVDGCVSCLDVGCGSGNISIKLLQRGWSVTVVDVSQEMLEILKDKCRTHGFAPTILNISVEEFLSTTDADYDLVSFGSVLHHTYSYHRVVELAARRVRPGGLFYSNCDPVPPQRRRAAQIFSSMDTLLARMLLDPGDVLPGIKRRFAKLLSKRDPRHGRVVWSAGDLAEYHARTGVDEEQVLGLLKENGFVILEHSRYPVGRTSVTQTVNRLFRLLENFKIIAQRRL